MCKFFIFLSSLGKILTIYLILFMMAFTLVYVNYDKYVYNTRCVLDINNYNFSFLDNYDEIVKYEIYVSCNSIDLNLYTNFTFKKEGVALAIKLSSELVGYQNLYIVIMLQDNQPYYFKIIEEGLVLVS